MVLVQRVDVDRKTLRMITKARLARQPPYGGFGRRVRAIDADQLGVVTIFVVGAHMVQDVNTILVGQGKRS
jgi:hypothetical protein